VPASRSPARRIGAVRVACFLISCTFLATSWPLVFGVAVAAPSTASGCVLTPNSIDHAELAIGSTINATRARALANSSILTDEGEGNLSRASNLSFTSLNLNFSIEETECSVSLESVDVAFSATLTSGQTYLFIVENPSLTSVHGMFREASGSVSAATIPHWDGYELEKSTSPADGAWYVPYIQSNEGNHCGGGIYSWGKCDFLIWAGQANAAFGSTGLAQAGTELKMRCEWTLGGWTCPIYYEVWYEFFPYDSTIVPLWNTTSGDLIEVVTSYNSTSKEYSLSIQDFGGNGWYKSDLVYSPAKFMGAPSWGEFQGEDPLNGGSPLPVEKFSNLTVAMADPIGYAYGCGLNCLTGIYHHKYNNDSSILQVTPLFYGVSEPPGVVNCETYTCFTESYV
jgi:hypothetical protein